MCMSVFDAFHGAIVDALDQIQTKRKAKTRRQSETDNKPGDDDPSTSLGESDHTDSTHQGKLIPDATVVEQAIRCPIDQSFQW